MSRLSRGFRDLGFLSCFIFVVAKVLETAPAASIPKIRNERRGELPATVGTALNVDQVLEYLNSYYSIPPSSTTVGTLHVEFGHLPHDRMWANERIEAVVWDLTFAAPIWCDYSRTTNSCSSLSEMTCL